jgi:hypothetical protein
MTYAFVSKRKSKSNSSFRIPEVTSAEQSKAYKDYGNSCINDTGVAKGVYDDLRTQEVLLKGHMAMHAV